MCLRTRSFCRSSTAIATPKMSWRRVPRIRTFRKVRQSWPIRSARLSRVTGRHDIAHARRMLGIADHGDDAEPAAHHSEPDAREIYGRAKASGSRLAERRRRRLWWNEHPRIARGRELLERVLR